MSTYSNRLQPALQNLLQRVVRFFHPRSSCTTTHISVDVQRIILNASCMTISGERTKQLDKFCHVSGFTSFHSCGTYSVLSRSPSIVFCSYTIKSTSFSQLQKLGQTPGLSEGPMTRPSQNR